MLKNLSTKKKKKKRVMFHFVEDTRKDVRSNRGERDIRLLVLQIKRSDK